MKHTRLALAFAALALSTPAWSASVTLLQFGSFESREEAEKRLSDISAKHGKLLTGLSTNVREIKLPPDNLPVYRTQAGPVEDRAAAQAICAKLAGSGDECYIVQTAMTAGLSKPATEAVTDTKSSVLAETKQTPIENPPLAASASTQTASAASAAAGTPSVAAAATQLTSHLRAAAPSAASTESHLPKASLLAETATAAPVLGVETSSSAAASAPSTAGLESALDAASTTEASTAEAITKAVTAPKRERSFWSRLNPFSDEDDQAASASSESALTMDEKAQSATTTEQLPASTPEPVVPSPLPVEATTTPKVAETIPSTPTPAFERAALEHPPILPPPPAPLRATDREALASKAAASSVPTPLDTSSLAPAASGNVSVEEAKRVPVTETAPIASPEIAVNTTPAYVPTPPLQPEVSLRPSATDGQKTLWAQIGPFKGPEEALAFWNQYRSTHPDFPVVRVRVINPYQLQLKNRQQSWLRVGPVLKEAFVKYLCATIKDPEKEQLYPRCGLITDISLPQPKHSTTSKGNNKSKSSAAPFATKRYRH